MRSTAAIGSLALYFASTFALAWLLWFAAAVAVPPDFATPGVRALLFLPGTLAPGIVALWLVARTEGDAAVHALLRRVLLWDVGIKWYVFAVAYLVGVKLLAAVAHRALAGAWPAFGAAPFYLMLGAVVVSTPIQAGEEIGWRGYALPRLAERMGIARASIVLGVIWACWHLPLFYIAGTGSTGQPFPVYLLAVTAVSVALAWLYVGTGGSLLLVMIMHAALNNTAGIVVGRMPNATNPMVLTATSISWITTALLWVGALYFLVRLRRSPHQRS